MERKRKINNSLKSGMIGLIVGVTTQYIVQFVIKLLNGSSLKESSIVTAPWQVYYTAGISGGINGFIVSFIPESLYPFASILVAVSTYSALLTFSSEEEFTNQSDTKSFVSGIVRDIFLISLIIYIIRNIMPSNKKDNDFNNILSSSIVTSIIISISFNLSQTGINNILELTNRFNIVITDE